MPQSLSNVLVHLVFSTKERQPFLSDATLRMVLHKYLAAVSEELRCPVIKVGGAEDHVHILARQARTITLAGWVRELKRTSSLWMKELPEGHDLFQWQAGYGTFSVSQSQSAAVERYIARQEAHHRRVSFQDEFRHCSTGIRSPTTNGICGTEKGCGNVIGLPWQPPNRPG